MIATRCAAVASVVERDDGGLHPLLEPRKGMQRWIGFLRDFSDEHDERDCPKNE
jgi:hypothetical protein